MGDANTMTTEAGEQAVPEEAVVVPEEAVVEPEDLDSCKEACNKKFGAEDEYFGLDDADADANANPSEGGRRRSRRRGFKGSKKGKTRKGNKMLSSWVAFVKKVQHEEKISYSDAMKRASARKKEWKMGQMGGEDGSMMSSMGMGMNKSKSQNQSQYGGNEYGAQKTAMANSNMMSAGRRRRRGSKRRGSKRRGSRRSRR